MIEAGDATLNVAWIGGVAFGLDRQIADDADALTRSGVVKDDARPTDDLDLADCRTVLPCHRPASPSEQDVGNRGLLSVVGLVVDVEHDFPWSARLYAVEEADRHDGLQPGKVDAVGVAVVDVPRQGAKAFPETGRPAGTAAHAAARVNRTTIGVRRYPGRIGMAAWAERALLADLIIVSTAAR
jgi:hypothetical protein